MKNKKLNIEALRNWLHQRSRHLSPQIKNIIEKSPPLYSALLKLKGLHWIFIALIAFLSADLVMLGAQHFLTSQSPPPRRDSQRIIEAPPRVLSMNDYRSTLDKNIFCPGCPIPDLEITPVERPRDCNQATPLDSGIELIGTIVLDDGRHSVASLRVPGGQTLAAQTGDTVPSSGEVFEIRQGRVCFIHNDQVVFVEIPEEPVRFGQPMAQTPQARREQARPRVAQTPGIDQISETEFHISRTTLLEKLSDPNLLFQAHAVPHRGADGAIECFKILSIQPGSVYESLGVQVGDCIAGVDGEPLDSIARAQELFMSARTASEVNIDLDRDGQRVNQRYTIR